MLMQDTRPSSNLHNIGFRNLSKLGAFLTQLHFGPGLEYLHVRCSPAIFHRDVQSNNILLGDKMIAKVADFGLSKSTNSKDNVSHVSTMVKGYHWLP